MKLGRLNFSRKALLKVTLSFFIVFNLLSAVVTPNPFSIMGDSLFGFVGPYASSLGMSSTWQFFSPNPVTRQFLVYTVDMGFDVDDEDEDLVEHHWPELDKSKYSLANYRRILAHSMMTSTGPGRARKYLIPFLCSKHKGAQSITVRTVTHPIPGLHKAALKGDSFNQLERRQKLARMTGDCFVEESEGEL